MGSCSSYGAHDRRLPVGHLRRAWSDSIQFCSDARRSICAIPGVFNVSRLPSTYTLGIPQFHALDLSQGPWRALGAIEPIDKFEPGRGGATPAASPVRNGPRMRSDPMESATFWRWLAERGCAFDQSATGQGAHGIASVTAHRDDRKAVLPLVVPQAARSAAGQGNCRESLAGSVRSPRRKKPRLIAIADRMLPSR